MPWTAKARRNFGKVLLSLLAPCPIRLHHKRDGHPPQLCTLCVIGSVLSQLCCLWCCTCCCSRSSGCQRCQRWLAFLDLSPTQEFDCVLPCGRIAPKFLKIIMVKYSIASFSKWLHGSRELPGHSAHRDPYEMSNPNHHLTAKWNSSSLR